MMQTPPDGAIEVSGLTKRYGTSIVVDDMTFQVHPGQVTGFLGPNGAGKSTTMKMILGLVHPTSGSALIEGVPYRNLEQPARVVGAMLDPTAAQGHRTGREHLAWMAAAARVEPRVVDEKLELVDLAHAAHDAVSGYSLGMRQRLALAGALLSEPRILILDEPINGLDPEGIGWMRDLLKDFAAHGRTVFISSHLMAEMEKTADRVIIINRGRFVEDVTVTELTARAAGLRIDVASEDDRRLAEALTAAGASVRPTVEGLQLTGLEPIEVGRVALRAGVALAQLHQEHASLEEAFLALTRPHEGATPTTHQER